MKTREEALEGVAARLGRYFKAQDTLEQERDELSDICREANEAGVPDQAISDLATVRLGRKISRARIQQLRAR